MIAWLAALVLTSDAGTVVATEVPRVAEPAAAYLLNCGGCHGILGHSSDRAVPSLRGQVDAFLCLPEGREYIVRLPNVAFAPLSDGQLAALMNFVVSLGKPRDDIEPYTAAEVGALRRRPLMGQPIAVYRRELVKKLISTCDAPRSLLSYQ